MRKGDIVLIPFPFTDLSGQKNRPAVILLTSDSAIIVAFITSQLKWQDEFDLKLEPTPENGLKKTSLVRLGKIATLDNELVLGKLGNLVEGEIKDMNKNLIRLLQLDF